ncbi:MAG TPA: hypothetical protein PKG95_02125 [Anaerolineaceae bacterium]|nr:hypothetical protein [Anaerolineaceae bacterium]
MTRCCHDPGGGHCDPSGTGGTGGAGGSRLPGSRGQQDDVFPGGQAEGGESPTAADGREAAAELGRHILLGLLAAIVLFGDTQQYDCCTRQICGGDFGTGQGLEIQG